MKRLITMLFVLIGFYSYAQVPLNPNPRTPASGQPQRVIWDTHLRAKLSWWMPFTNSITPAIVSVDSAGSNSQMLSNGYLAVSKGLGTGFFQYAPTSAIPSLIDTTVFRTVANSFTKAETNSRISTLITAGKQTLSLGATNGNIIISGGNNVSLTSLAAISSTVDAGASGVYALQGLRSNVVSAAATGYPFSGSGGSSLTIIRSANNTAGGIEISKSVAGTDSLLYIRTGASGNTFSPFMSFASRYWVNTGLALKANIANPTFTTGITTPKSTITTTAVASAREVALTSTISDASGSRFDIYNSTATDAFYAPGFSGYNISTPTLSSIYFNSQTNSANDSGSIPLMTFTSKLVASGDPISGTFSDVVNRQLFAWRNNTTTYMLMDAGGNLGVTNNVTAGQFRLSALNTAPASATATGTLGEIRITSGFIYVCISTNVWVRAVLATW